MNATKRITQIFNIVINNVCANKEQYIKKPTDFTRNRKLGFKTMLTTIISMQGQTINKELFNAGIEVTNSAFIQARHKLSDDVMETIFHEFKIAPINKHKGYRIMAFDGTDIRIPYNENSPTFVKDSRSNTKNGYNSFHVNALFDVLNKQYVDASVDVKMDERKSAAKMVDRYVDDKAIVICDRGYIGYNLIEHFNRNQRTEYIIRSQHGKTALKCLRDLPMIEFDIDRTVTVSTLPFPKCKEKGYVKTYPPSPFGKNNKLVTWDFEETCEINLRIVRVLLLTGEYETLITSLPRDKWSAEEVKELYHLRWGIETSFREFKYYIGGENIHSKIEDFIKQEIYANLIAYNFCAAIAMTVKIRNYNSQKYEYVIDFSYAFHVIKDYLRDFSKSPPSKIDSLISIKILPVRDNRADERKTIIKNVVSFTYRVA